MSYFQPLFACLSYATTSISMNERLSGTPWAQPTAVINWYYCQYSAVRAMFVANQQEVEDTHLKARKSFSSGIRQTLPHPLNMVASHQGDERYLASLPNFETAQPFSLVKQRPRSRLEARGMLLGYLNGTAMFYVDEKKNELKEKYGYENFRSQGARDKRNKELRKCVGYLDCAFRFRGKANYRDAIFLTYDDGEVDEANLFLGDLAAVCRFMFVAALAYVEKRVGKNPANEFIQEAREHQRGLCLASEGERLLASITV